jgi:C-terminal processing protease CtpA/Prc
VQNRGGSLVGDKVGMVCKADDKKPWMCLQVKPDSRAEKAGIRPGDKLKRINDIDTSTLTIQEAHEIIIESGIHLKLAVTA